MAHLGLQRIMIPGSQVSALTTGSITLPGAKGTFNLWDGPDGAFDALASVTLSSGSNTITFTGIPDNYKHLQLRSTNLSSGSNNNIILRFNGDSGNNYSEHAMVGSGSSATAYASANASYASAGYTADATYPAPSVCDIFDYSNVSKNKVVRAYAGNDNNNTSSYVTLHSSAWYNTAAIYQIEIIHGNIAGGKVFNANTTFSLYGVK